MIAFLLALVAAVESPTFNGTLCISDLRPCITTKAANVAGLELAEKPRPWVWTSSDGSRIAVGELQPKMTTVDVPSKGARRLTLSLNGSAQRGWPGDVEVTILQGRERRWEWTVPSQSVRKLRELSVPQGNYVLSFASPRHMAARRPLRPTGEMVLGEVQLQPLPAIRGRLVRKEGEKTVALAGGQVAAGDGRLLTATRHDGTFEAELSEPIPEEIVLFHPGLATRIVSLKSDVKQTALGAETDLGEIVMESGVRLALRIVRVGDAAGRKLRVRLFSDLLQKYELVRVAAREVAADDTELTFADLTKGRYFIAIEGDTPLEFLMRAVELKEEETAETVEIKPYRLAGTVRFGEEAVREGSVGISAGRLRREMKLPIDEEGRFGGVLWQHGKVHGWVSSKAIGSVVPMESPDLGADPSTWTIALRRRLIEGRVFDAETKQPLAGASMRLEKQTGQASSSSRLYTSVDVAEDGRYAIAAIDDGTYDIKVQHPERIAIARTVELRDVDPSQVIDFALQRGVETKIEFVWASGMPVANAAVIEGVARDGHNPLRMFSTDAGGRLAIHSQRGEKRTLFVLPREGSLTAAMIAGGSSDETLRVVVPPAAGAIQVTLRNREGKPAPGIVLMRFNGDWIPQSVVGRIPGDRSTAGVVRFTGLPAGTYEFWGVKPPAGFEGTFAAPASEPVRVGLGGGEQRIDLPIQ